MLIAISFLFLLFVTANFSIGTGQLCILVFVKYCIIRVHSSVYRSLHLFHRFIFVIIHSYFIIFIFSPCNHDSHGSLNTSRRKGVINIFRTDIPCNI